MSVFESLDESFTNQFQMVGLPLASSWSSPDYQEYLDILPLLVITSLLPTQIRLISIFDGIWLTDYNIECLSL